MVMSNCRECNNRVSSEAKVCPHCGIRNPVIQHCFAKYVLTTFVFIGFVWLFISVISDHGPSDPSCKENWQSCSDNSEVVKYWSGWKDVQAACVKALNEKGSDAGYWSDVELSPKRFSTPTDGRSFIDYGMANAADNCAKAKNLLADGVVTYAQAVCSYDLKKRKVASVAVVAGPVGTKYLCDK